MEFRVNLTVEVDQVGNALAIRTPVPLQLVCRSGRWQAQSENPPISTDEFDTLEQALAAGAQQVAVEVQAAVIDRPLIIGRITPKDIPVNMF